MADLESGSDKVKKICDILKKETLDPAQAEAQKILSEAHTEKERILSEAKAQASDKLKECQAEIERERTHFQTAMKMAKEQAVATLQEQVVKELFRPTLKESVKEGLSDPSLIAKIITALVTAIEKEGTHSDLTAAISESISKEALLSHLQEKVVARLKEIKSVPLEGGASVKIEDDNISLEMTLDAVESLLMTYIQEDIRDFLYG